MARKTITIDNLVDKINTTLRLSTADRSQRQSLCCLLENILHETGNYRGFRYLTQAEVPADHLPGIIRGVVGDQGVITNVFPDNTRVQYF